MSDYLTDDQEIVETMKVKILGECKRNLRTRDYDDSKMVKRIKNIIQEELECYSNR